MVQFPYDVRLRNLLSTLIICTMVVHQALCKFQTVIHGTEYNMILISNLESKTDKYEVIIIWKMQTPMDIITISTINCFLWHFFFSLRKIQFINCTQFYTFTFLTYSLGILCSNLMCFNTTPTHMIYPLLTSPPFLQLQNPVHVFM